MSDYPVTERNRLRRLPDRGAYDRTTIHAVLDEGYVAHVGLVSHGSVVVLPMAYVRIDESLYLHGSRASRLMQALADGAKVCVTVTHLDGLVLARSAFHHSMNYRSVVVYGHGRTVAPEGKARVLDALMERIAPGRAREVRAPSPAELSGTLVVEIPMVEASAKIRTGPPKDDEADRSLPVWAGVIPVHRIFGAPLPDRGCEERALPSSLPMGSSS